MGRVKLFVCLSIIFSFCDLLAGSIYFLSNTLVNPLPHIDAFWCLCSRWLFEKIVTKEEIAQNKQFLLLPQCFPLLVIGYPFNYREFLFVDICSKSSAADLLYVGKGYITNLYLWKLQLIHPFSNQKLGNWPFHFVLGW